jgi:hypothetical protein
MIGAKMNFTLPAHLRKKDEDTVANLFEKAVANEINALVQKYSSAAVIFNNYGMQVSSSIRSTSREMLIGLFCDATGNIDNGFDEPQEGMIAQAVLKNDEAALMRVMKKLIHESIKREAERNVENFIPEEDF